MNKNLTRALQTVAALPTPQKKKPIERDVASLIDLVFYWRGTFITSNTVLYNPL